MAHPASFGLLGLRRQIAADHPPNGEAPDSGHNEDDDDGAEPQGPELHRPCTHENLRWPRTLYARHRHHETWIPARCDADEDDSGIGVDPIARRVVAAEPSFLAEEERSLRTSS
jgi:hypothetical protein